MTSDEIKYFNPEIRKTLTELGVAEALTAYDAKRNSIILRECVATLRRCADLLEQGKSLNKESFIYSPSGHDYGSDDLLLCLTPALEQYGIYITAQDFEDINPYTPENYDPLDKTFKGY